MSQESFGRRDLFRRLSATGAAMGLAGAAAGPMGMAAAQDSDDAPLEKVPTRKLGATGQDIPILLMGGSQKFDPTYDKMLHTAFKSGMFYIDTAEKYANGQSHVTLKPFIEQVGRKNLWITSKSGMFPSAEAQPPQVYYDTIMKEFDVLGTDYLDMYFMHGAKQVELMDKPYIELGERLKKEGKAKFFGFSCHDGTVVELMNKAAKWGSGAVDAIMFRYNFTMYGNTELNKAMDACVAAGIGLIAMKTQSSVPQDAEMVQKFESDKFTLHQARLKAAWADERLSACVSGITNMQILRENLGAAKSTAALAMNEFMQLNRFAAETAPYRCQGCHHLCETNVKGNLRIADTLRYLMYDECYGNREEARQLYNALARDEREFNGVDLTAAMAACPQGINLPERLAVAQSRLA